MNKPRPKSPIWLRLAAAILGAFLILWLPGEDSGTGIVLALAALICLWLAVYRLHTLSISSWKDVGRYGLYGSLFGTAVVPTALLLMAIKTGLHAHPVTDFTANQITGLFSRAPIWMIAGLIIGLGSGMWRYLLSSQPVTN